MLGPKRREREVRKQAKNFSRRLPHSTTAFHLSHDCRAFTWQDSAAQRMNLRRKRDVRHTTKNIHEQVDSFALCVPFHGSLEWVHKDETTSLDNFDWCSTNPWNESWRTKRPKISLTTIDPWKEISISDRPHEKLQFCTSSCTSDVHLEILFLWKLKY